MQIIFKVDKWLTTHSVPLVNYVLVFMIILLFNREKEEDKTINSDVFTKGIKSPLSTDEKS